MWCKAADCNAGLAAGEAAFEFGFFALTRQIREEKRAASSFGAC
jgi:hypothetical protein